MGNRVGSSPTTRTTGVFRAQKELRKGLLCLFFNTERKKIMGKFIVKETATGFKFDLKATNGQVIATSEVYTTKAACLNGIESVKASCLGGVEDLTVEPVVEVKHPKFELFCDKAGEYRFRLKARNGEVVAVSEGYKTKANCENGIESVKANAPEAEIE